MTTQPTRPFRTLAIALLSLPIAIVMLPILAVFLARQPQVVDE